MKYVIQTSFPWHPSPPVTEPDRFAETPEEAGQLFGELAGWPSSLRLDAVVEKLALDERVEYQDPESGRTVVARLAQVGAGV
jgi:hypothetical protein